MMGSHLANEDSEEIKRKCETMIYHSSLDHKLEISINQNELKMKHKKKQQQQRNKYIILKTDSTPLASLSSSSYKFFGFHFAYTMYVQVGKC